MSIYSNHVFYHWLIGYFIHIQWPVSQWLTKIFGTGPVMDRGQTIYIKIDTCMQPSMQSRDLPNHKVTADVTAFSALQYGLGSLSMVNHCNRKKGPTQKKERTLEDHKFHAPFIISEKNWWKDICKKTKLMIFTLLHWSHRYRRRQFYILCCTLSQSTECPK